MNSEANQAVRLLVGDAHEWLVELVGSEAEPQMLVDGCCDQLENIAMAAEFAELDELQQAARQWIDTLESAPHDSADELRDELTRVVQWVDSRYQALAVDPAEPGSDSAPSADARSLEEFPALDELDVAAAVDAESEDTEDPPPLIMADAGDYPDVGEDELPEGEWDVQPVVGNEEFEPLADLDAGQGEAGGTHPLLVALADELRAMREELPEIDSSSPVTALQAHLDVLVNLSNACVTLGLPGLEGVFDRLADNLRDLVAHPDTLETSVPVLASWPGRVLDYLDQGAAPRACAALVELLESDGWPLPLGETGARALIEQLASVPEEDGSDEPQRPAEASADDVSLAMSDDAHEDLIAAFFQEAPDQAAELASCLQQISRGHEMAGNVLVAQRIAHTLKGAGHLVGVRGVANLAHHLEDIFEALAHSGRSPSPALAATLQDAADCMESMIDFLQGHAVAPDNALQVLQEVLDWAGQIDAGEWDDLTGELVDEAGEAAEPGEPGAATASEAAAPATAEAPETPSGIEAADYMRVATNSIAEMFRMAGEVTIGMAQIQDRIHRLLEDSTQIHDQDGALQRNRLELENQVGVRSLAAAQRRERSAEGGDEFDSLELDRYDALYGTAYAFIESVVDMRELALDLQTQLRQLDGLFINQRRLNGELQELILGTRMVPASTLSGRLQRAVRQAGRTLHKQVDLTITGAELALDNDVLRRLADPLMHILRNAVDHGIEPAEERQHHDKPPRGEVQLRFIQEGSFVVVEVADDGRGFDYRRIREVAIERGQLLAEDPVDEAQLRRLVLSSGFSTRSQTTHISGRGVGMDVVHNSVAELKGSMELQDNEPCGCLIRIRLPTTLIASHCLLVTCGGERFAVPTHLLVQILAPDVGELSVLGQTLTYRLGKDVYEARQLSELLNLAIVDVDDPVVLLVTVDDQVVAVAVDQVAESRDLVLKGFGRYVKAPPGVSGVSVLGDGSVVPVLDLPEMLRAPLLGHQGGHRLAALAEDHSKKVLIVDDSLSVRRTLAELVSDAGYRPQAARDGLEAVKLLESERADIILADLEMPRMNGLELVRHVRADQSLRDTPVVMITSRSLNKHRDQAKQAGVDLYLNKPFSHDELLDHIDRLLEAV